MRAKDEYVLTKADLNTPVEHWCGQGLLVGKLHRLFIMCPSYPLCQHIGGAL